MLVELTLAAANQIRLSAQQGKMEGMPLRIACRKNADDSLHYAMGFDDRGRDEDIQIVSEGITLVVSAASVPLIKGMKVDFVELSPGEKSFIFKNPNDPNYLPPQE